MGKSMRTLFRGFLILFITHVCFADIQQRKVPFKITPQDTLHLFIYESDVKSDLGPAIVFFFGGGWVHDNPSQFRPHSEVLAERGMVAVCAEYRIYSKHGITPFECVEDGKSAIRWIREHADSLGVDSNRIVAAGGSAGGHVAACTAVINGFENDAENLQTSSKPNALVLFNPVIDTWREGYGMEKIGENAKDISPVHHVKSALPPTLVFHGTADSTVPFENVERFCNIMHEAGNVCELIPFEGHNHAFFNYGRFDNQPYNKTIEVMELFLIKHGFLPGD